MVPAITPGPITLDPAGKLTELLGAGYAEKGDYGHEAEFTTSPSIWASSERIGFGCMFCHNGYPKSSGGRLLRSAEPRFRGRAARRYRLAKRATDWVAITAKQYVGAGIEKVRAAIM